MNMDFFYWLLLCFVSGFTQCALIGCAVFIGRYHRHYQFQKLFAVALVMHSLGFFNNFVVAACCNFPFSEYLNTLLVLYDYLIVGAYMMFAVSLVFPNKYRLWQLLVIEIPYTIAIILFAVMGSPFVYPVIQIFTLIVSLILVIYLEISIRKHTVMLRDNVGDMQYLDIRWISLLCLLLLMVQLIWAFESVSQISWFSTTETSQNLLFDTLYCIITLGFAAFATWKIARQKVFTDTQETGGLPASGQEASVLAEDTPKSETDQSTYYGVLADKDIEKIIRENRYFLDNTLTLQKLAGLLGTNRQYLSNYINQEKSMTFYDYINDFRLEEAKRLLDGKTDTHQIYMEEIATKAGFNSYATFLRSFAKKYGVTPSKYLRNRG